MVCFYLSAPSRFLGNCLASLTHHVPQWWGWVEDGEEEKENSAPVDASIGKEMPLTELQPEDAAAVPLSFLED